MKRQTKRNRGQSLSEYGFVLALVVVVAIGALLLLGTRTDELFRSSAGALERNTAGILNPDQGGNGNGNGNGNGGDASGVATVSLDLGNGRSVTLPNVPADLSRSVQTAGASGTTDLIAGNLMTLVDELLAAGEITPQQAADLRRIAQEMRSMADAQEVMEAKFGQCSERSCWESNHENIPSNLYYAAWGDDDDGFGGFFVSQGLASPSGGGYQGIYQQRLNQAFQDAVASGALRNPVVKDSVDVMISHVNAMASNMGQQGVSYWGAEYNNGTAADWDAVPNALARMADDLAADDTLRTLCSLGRCQ